MRSINSACCSASRWGSRWTRWKRWRQAHNPFVGRVLEDRRASCVRVSRKEEPHWEVMTRPFLSYPLWVWCGRSKRVILTLSDPGNQGSGENQVRDHGVRSGRVCPFKNPFVDGLKELINHLIPERFE